MLIVILFNPLLFSHFFEMVVMDTYNHGNQIFRVLVFLVHSVLINMPSWWLLFLRILCPILDEPKAKVTYDGHVKDSLPGELETNPLVSFSERGLEITIRKIPKILAGIVRCTAVNAFGTDVKQSIVNIEGKR